MIKIGHRGAKGHAAENTLFSFQKAFELGADGIELDVHICKSGEVVVIHDSTLNRTTNGHGPVSEFTLTELKELRIENNYTVPTLAEVLKSFGGRKLINIELKGDNTAESVVKLLDRYFENKLLSRSDIIISSFNPKHLEYFYQLKTEIRLGVITATDIDTALEIAMQFNAYSIHPEYHLLTKKNVKTTQEMGFKVIPWTVNDPEAIIFVKSLKVDGIISDFPDRL